MTTRPKHRILCGTVRLSYFQGRGITKPSIMLERTHGDIETGWYPAASYPVDEVPLLAEALMRFKNDFETAASKPASSVATGSSIPCECEHPTGGDDPDAEPPFDPTPTPTTPTPKPSTPPSASPPGGSRGERGGTATDRGGDVQDRHRSGPATSIPRPASAKTSVPMPAGAASAAMPAPPTPASPSLNTTGKRASSGKAAQPSGNGPAAPSRRVPKRAMTRTPARGRSR